jgi:hypothetical protein
MNFADYYGLPFRRDITAVLGGLAPMHEHVAGEVVLQPRTLSSLNPAVRALSDERQALFACALFLTIVADQVCYTHFRSAYDRFRALTQYPKLKGDCPGGCSAHIHPSNALAVGSEPGRPQWSAPDIAARLPADVLLVMRAEVSSFISEHLPELNPGEFWEQVDREIPVDLRLALALHHRAL